MDLRSFLQRNLKSFSGIKFKRDKTEINKTKTEAGIRIANGQYMSQNGTVPSRNKPNSARRQNNTGSMHNVWKEHILKENDNIKDSSEKAGDTNVKQNQTPLESTQGVAPGETPWGGEGLFPRYTHWFVFLCTIVFRVWYVSRRHNWWILHPDEIYQTLEVAHSEVYGYGFRAYEYLPEKLPGYYVSAARAEEVRLGMYSLRSFMLPHFISVFMLATDAVGIAATPYLVGRTLVAVMSSFLPLTVYGFTNTVFRSHDTATLAAILVATSQVLNVFGTHTLVNSFLSPLVFLSLSVLIKSVLKYIEQTKVTSKITSENQNLPRDQNSNLPVINKNHNSKKRKTPDARRNSKTEHVTDRRIICFWKQYAKYFSGIQFNSAEYFSGLCLSLCVYTRCDLVLLPVFIVLACTKLSCHKLFGVLLNLLVYLGGFVTGILIGGIYDHMCYGVWFISPYQWTKFNVFHAVSSILFGSEPLTFYIENILFSNSLNMILLAVLLLDIIVYQHLPHNLDNENSEKHSADFISLRVFLLLFLSYSLSAHKELRFFHNGIIFFYIHLSRAALRLLQFVVGFINQKHGQYYYYFYLFIGFLASSQILSFIEMQDNGLSKWTYMSNNVSNHVNECLDYINKQRDVTGVFLDQSVYMTGGYTILHKDVPIYGLNMHDFFEFSRGSRLNLMNAFNQNNSLSSFGHMSDFVSVYNTPYLLKQLISNAQYNYLVLDTDSKFIETGYSEVFQTGSSKVLKRQMTNENEDNLLKMASAMPIGNNATILEYEGYWLIRYGIYQIAQDKLLFANRLDQSRLGPYQLLIAMFRHFEQKELVKNVLDACVEVHKKSECLSKYVVIELDDS